MTPIGSGVRKSLGSHLSADHSCPVENPALGRNGPAPVSWKAPRRGVASAMASQQLEACGRLCSCKSSLEDLSSITPRMSHGLPGFLCWWQEWKLRGPVISGTRSSALYLDSWNYDFLFGSGPLFFYLFWAFFSKLLGVSVSSFIFLFYLNQPESVWWVAVSQYLFSPFPFSNRTSSPELQGCKGPQGWNLKSPAYFTARHGHVTKLSLRKYEQKSCI